MAGGAGSTRYDVGVIGGGPAGAWAAALLASRGARVVVADGSHPREKPCGGGVTGRALALVADALDRRALPAVRIGSARFVDTAGGVSAVVPLAPDGRDLVVVARAAFDRALLDAAGRGGARLAAARVVDVARADRRFVITLADGRACTADRIIGADGANSLTRRKLGRPFVRAQLSMATGYFVHGATATEVVVQLVNDPPGYIWSFPRPDHLAIGICAPADSPITAGTLRARVAEWMAASRAAPAGARVEPYSWPIPTLRAGDLSDPLLGGPGWLLAGDAAGLVDPITREGIFFALQSARFAADALTAAHPAPERLFAERVRAEIIGELRRAAALKARFFQPHFTRLLVDALRQSERVGRVMADLVAGAQTYRGLRRRLVRTMEIRLAWRLLRSGWLPDLRLIDQGAK